MAMKKSELRELYLMMFPEYPDIVNIAQLQSMLGISRHLAYDLINDGYIRGLKIGNAFRIPKVNVIEYVMDQGKSAISSVIASRYLAVFYEKIREPESPRHRRIDRTF